MFPFEQNRLNINALLKANHKIAVNDIKLEDYTLREKAKAATEDLLFVAICQNKKGYGLIELTEYIAVSKEDIEEFKWIKKQLFNRLMSNPSQSNQEKINEVLNKGQLTSHQEGLLWAYYFYALANTNYSLMPSLRFLYALLGPLTMMEIEKKTLAYLIEQMTIRVQEKGDSSESFMKRYNLAIDAINLEYGIESKKLA